MRRIYDWVINWKCSLYSVTFFEIVVWISIAQIFTTLLLLLLLLLLVEHWHPKVKTKAQAHRPSQTMTDKDE